jgi:hypothetical protein
LSSPPPPPAAAAVVVVAMVHLPPQQSQLEYLRLRSAKHEILVAPRPAFTVIVFQEWTQAGN